MKKKVIDKARTASKQISKERQKKTGECFTPPKLINEMLDNLPANSFQPGKTMLEPAAGDGNMVMEFLKRKVVHGCSKTQALKDVYAVEYMKDNWEAMKQRILDWAGDTAEHREIIDYNIAHANFLDPNDTEEGRKYPIWLLMGRYTLIYDAETGREIWVENEKIKKAIRLPKKENTFNLDLSWSVNLACNDF